MPLLAGLNILLILDQTVSTALKITSTVFGKVHLWNSEASHQTINYPFLVYPIT